MAKKILNILTNNIGFKILSLFFAVVLWLMVYNTDDPNVSRTYKASLSLLNEDYAAEQNLYYEVLDGNTISVVVTGKRSVINNLEDSDFTATADMSRMEIAADGTSATIPLEFSSARSNSTLKFTGRTNYIHISLEELMTKSFTVTPNVVGEVAEGYALGATPIAAPTMIKVTGPKSVVNTIASVIATIDVSNYSGSQFVDYAIPELLDEEGNHVDTSKLSLSKDQVTITAQLLSTKTVPIRLNYSGTPGDGLSVETIESDISSVMIKGASGVLNSIAAIDIPAEVINVEGVTMSFTTTIDISEYLPNNVDLVDSSQSTITVTVTIEAYEAREYTINTADLSIKGLDENLEIVYGSETLTVTVNGRASDLNSLTAEMLTGSIDLTGMVAGSHSAMVDFDLDSSEYAISRVTVSFVLQEKEEPGDDPGEDPNEDPTDDPVDEGDDGNGDEDPDTDPTPGDDNTTQTLWEYNKKW